MSGLSIVWRAPRRLTLAAGAEVVVTVRGRATSRSWSRRRRAAADLVLVVTPPDGRGGETTWHGERGARGWIEWRVPISVARGSQLERRRFLLAVVDRDTRERSPARPLAVDVEAGYALVDRSAGDAVRLRNRTATAWPRHEVWLALTGETRPAVGMSQAYVGPGATATFAVPAALRGRSLDLVHHRVGRYQPAPLRRVADGRR